jgi:phage shock protein A
MAYVKNFKSFQSAEKKASDEVEAGANPAVDEEATPAPAAQQAVQTTPTPTQTPTNPSPAVQAAQKAVTDIDAQIAALNSQIAGLQAKRATAQATVNTAAAQKA